MSPAIVTAPADCSIWSAGLSAPECHLRYSTNWPRASGPAGTPFLTDADLPLGLEAIEVLAAAQPETAVALQAFATPILSRIGPHNARRIDAALLETARMLAPDFGLELPVPAGTDAGTGNEPESGQAARWKFRGDLFAHGTSCRPGCVDRAAVVPGSSRGDLRRESGQ